MISVIVPVYNARKYLAECVESLLAQTYSDLEILLINDGSTDGSGELCDEFARRDARVRVLHKPNGGASDTRNLGFAEFRGEYVACIDADDRVDPRTFEVQLNAMETNQADIVISGVRLFTGDTTIKVVSPPNRLCNTKEATALFLQPTSYMNSIWNKLFRREILFGFQSKSYAAGNDLAVSYQAVHRARRIVLISDVLYHYRIHSESIIHRPFQLSRLDSLKSFDDMAASIRSWYPDMEDQLCACEARFCLVLLKKMVAAPTRYPEQEQMLTERIRQSLRGTEHPPRPMRLSLFCLRMGRPFFRASVLCKNRLDAYKLKRKPPDPPCA